MNELRDRLERELNDVPVAPRSALHIVAFADRRRRLRRIGTVGLASIIALGSIALISRAFDTPDAGPADIAAKGEERIIFNSVPWPESPGQLYSVRPDGTGLERLTQAGADFLSPAVSPDGSMIAFVRFVQGFPPTPIVHEGIYVMRADGSDMRELLTTGKPKPVSVSQLAWSPDGSQIAFIRNFYVGHSESDFGHELWIMGADGSEPHRIVDRQIESFSWAPDGSRIAFAEQGLNGDSFAWDLHLMDADGSNAEQLTNDGRSRLPAWSPDGATLAYQRWGDDRPTQVYVMNIGDPGRAAHPILTGRAGFDSLTWSPDSSAVAISAFDRQSNRCSIQEVTLEGDVSTVLESELPERGSVPPGAEQLICPGTLVWAFVKTVEAPPASASLVIDHIKITDPLNERSQVEAEAVATWSRGEFPGFHRCVFIARDQTGQEVGRYDDIVVSLSPSISIRVDASSPASSMDGECGPRLDTGTPYRYDFSNVHVSREFPGPITSRVAVVGFDAKWAGGGQAGAVRCRVTILDDAGAVVGSGSFNFYLLTGSGTDLATRVEVQGTATRADISCSPFSG
jgi:dipeptidyl aminopeptidase/acylaminoacyl peptidase